jgi:alpha-L-fucosidase 2
MRPPWSDNFTNNINVQMNYWPAEVCNLSELHEPMLRFINDLEINGKKTASINYNCEGWCAHHNSDIWASTNPVGDNGSRGTGSIRWANWCMAGPWYCQHLWQHYEYTLDKNFLKDDAYPLMKGAAEFLLDWLVEGSDGTLVTIPSTSPENAFITDEGVEAAAQMASTMDMTLARELFTNLIKASEILEIDGEFRELLVKKRERLTPLKIGKYGQLQEWYYDWDRLDDKHRHISHIYGLYPGDIITTESTPELAAACEKSLEMRGDEGTGWSSAWKTCTWARLKDGNRAYKMFDYILRYVDPSNYSRGNLGGGSYPNLLGACPPFMIDGSFGISSGIAEMLMQSHAGVIQLLPAIPDNWSYGSITGLRARGGFEVDINWKDGKLTEVTVKSLKGTEMNVSYVGKKITHPTKVGDIFTFSISDFI